MSDARVQRVTERTDPYSPDVVVPEYIIVPI